MADSFYDFRCQSIDGRSVHMGDYRGQVVLIVNTASQCGFTPQFRELEQLYRDYHDRGFQILGFPCNQFAWQEPGTAADIIDFCTVNYGVSFPMFDKIAVNGANAEPLFTFLKNGRPGLAGTKMIKWNFTKFLVDREGRVIKRFAPTARVSTIEVAVRSALGEGQ